MRARHHKIGRLNLLFSGSDNAWHRIFSLRNSSFDRFACALLFLFALPAQCHNSHCVLLTLIYFWEIRQPNSFNDDCRRTISSIQMSWRCEISTTWCEIPQTHFIRVRRYRSRVKRKQVRANWELIRNLTVSNRLSLSRFVANQSNGSHNLSKSQQRFGWFNYASPDNREKVLRIWPFIEHIQKRKERVTA